MTPVVAYALATAVHAGFQLTVTLLVYPALATRDSEEWAAAHGRHSRVTAPLVAVLYAALLGTAAVLVVDGPGPAGWLALVATGAALADTAVLAAPLHGRLQERDAVLVQRLLVVDRWRCAAAVVGALAAVAAVAA